MNSDLAEGWALECAPFLPRWVALPRPPLVVMRVLLIPSSLFPVAGPEFPVEHFQPPVAELFQSTGLTFLAT